MNKLIPSIKKSLTNDWAALLPQFMVYKPMWLARRIGPLIQGVCLDRDSSNSDYLPTLHVHCLCRPFPDVSLSLGQPLLSIRSGAPDRISVSFHESKYKDACARLLSSSLLPVQGGWSLVQLIQAYERYRFLERWDSRYPVKLMEDAVSVCSWIGDIHQARILINNYINEAKAWPESILIREGGLTNWSDALNLLAVSGDLLRKNVNEQIDLLKLGKLPESQLLIS